MIPRPAFIPFIMREHHQSAHLIKSLRGHYQKEYAEPEREVHRLRRNLAHKLAAHNPYAREYWMREWGGRLCHRLGAAAPDWEPRQPVFFITLIDEQQIVYPTGIERGWRPNPGIDGIRRIYRRALRGFDHFGMLDPTLYVSTQRVEGVPRFILWHAHALVWNTSVADLDVWAKDLRPTMRAYLPYATGVDHRPVRPDGLRQLIWYISKTPRKQYQLFKRDTNSLQQYDGPLNGVNAVRLYSEMRNMKLPQLSFAAGEGRRIIRATMKATCSW